jgi:hypothetical protein
MAAGMESVAAFPALDKELETLRKAPGAFRPAPDYTGQGIAELAEFGGPIGHWVSKERMPSVRRWLTDARSGAGASSVFVDTTSIAAIDALLGPDDYRRFVTPETLSDLANFVSACVLNERIVHLENDHVDNVALNGLLGNEAVAVQIPVDAHDQGGVAGFLTAIWYQAIDQIQRLKQGRNRASASEEIRKLSEAWGRLFDVDGASLDVLDTAARNWSFASSGPGLIDSLVNCSGDDATLPPHFVFDATARRDPEALGALASECNHRFLFNQLFSEILGRRYVPSAFRAPFQQLYVRRSWQITRQVSLADFIDKAYRDRIEDAVRQGETPFVVPFFLGAILKKIARLEEFPAALAELRHRARPLRERLAALESAIAAGDAKETDALRRAVSGEPLDLGTFVQPVAICAAAAAAIPTIGTQLGPALIVTLMALTYASQFPAGAVKRLKDRVLRPEFRVLMGTAQSSRLIASESLRDVARLWKLRESPAEAIARQLMRAD